MAVTLYGLSMSRVGGVAITASPVGRLVSTVAQRRSPTRTSFACLSKVQQLWPVGMWWPEVSARVRPPDRESSAKVTPRASRCASEKCETTSYTRTPSADAARIRSPPTANPRRIQETECGRGSRSTG